MINFNRCDYVKKIEKTWKNASEYLNLRANSHRSNHSILSMDEEESNDLETARTDKWSRFCDSGPFLEMIFNICWSGYHVRIAGIYFILHNLWTNLIAWPLLLCLLSNFLFLEPVKGKINYNSKNGAFLNEWTNEKGIL